MTRAYFRKRAEARRKQLEPIAPLISRIESVFGSDQRLSFDLIALDNAKGVQSTRAVYNLALADLWATKFHVKAVFQQQAAGGVEVTLNIRPGTLGGMGSVTKHNRRTWQKAFAVSHCHGYEETTKKVSDNKPTFILLHYRKKLGVLDPTDQAHAHRLEAELQKLAVLFRNIHAKPIAAKPVKKPKQSRP